MAVQDTLTWDLVPPRRPGLDDLQVVPKSQPAGLPAPNPAFGPTAEEDNQKSEQIAAGMKVTPVVVLSLIYDTTSAIFELSQFACPGDNPQVSTFAVATNGTGDGQVTWPAQTFPGAAAGPAISVNGADPAMACIQPIVNGVRWRTEDAGGPINVPVTIVVF